MKYDLRINNHFWKEIEGNDIESALNDAGMDVDFVETSATGGYLYYESADLYGMAKSESFPEELNDFIMLNWDDVILTPTFGIAD